MSTIRSTSRIFCILLVIVLITGITPARAQTIGTQPAGIQAADWAKIKALMPTAAVTDAQQAYLKASNPVLYTNFGFAVAADGDTVAVGSPGEDSGATGVNGVPDYGASSSGAVYVFTRSGSTWSQQAYIKASNTSTGDQFGTSLAMSGDTLVVGAPEEASNATGVNGDQTNNSAYGTGAVYVFTRSGSDWSQQAYLKASNAGPGDQFGGVVAISGNTVVVGSIGEDSNSTTVNGNQANDSAEKSGAAYVFTRSGSDWSQQAYLKASNAEADDYFGSSVAISGETLVVGAIYEDSSATGVNGNQADQSASSSGAAYVFARSGNTWSQQAYLKASNTGSLHHFGTAVAISADTLVVTAPDEGSDSSGVNGDQTNDTPYNYGAAYIFMRSGQIWSQQTYLKSSNPGWNDTFGTSVAISGDKLVIGAAREESNATGINGNQTDNSADHSGAAYLFARDGNIWAQQAYIKASNTQQNDQFGWSVAISGETIVIGASNECSNASGVNGNQADNSTTEAGAAYVFYTPDTTPPTVDTFAATSPSESAIIPITDFSASDDYGVTGYMITDSPTPPATDAAGWTASHPWTYTFTSNGNHTLYPWAKDAVGNVSAVGSGFPVTVNDNTAPTIDGISYFGNGTTAQAQVEFAVGFSEPVVNIDPADFSVDTTGDITGAFVSSVKNWGATAYLVTVQTGNGDGTLKLSMPASANATDLVGHPISNLPYTGDMAYTINKTWVNNTNWYGYDGWILESSENSNMGGSVQNTSDSLILGDNSTRQQYRSILVFDVESLPANAVITKVVLRLRKKGLIGSSSALTKFGGFMVDVKKGFFGSTPALQIRDFQATANRSYGPFKPTLLNGWYSIDLTAAKDLINRSSASQYMTQFRLRFKLDDNNNTTANGLRFYSGESSNNPYYAPRLVISYYLP